jgi:hypothetical protein
MARQPVRGFLACIHEPNDDDTFVPCCSRHVVFSVGIAVATMSTVVRVTHFIGMGLDG